MTEKSLLINTNIVQAVKICYKRKIDSRDFRGGFYRHLELRRHSNSSFWTSLACISLCVQLTVLSGWKCKYCLVAVNLPVYKYSSDIFHKEKNLYL